MGQTLTGSKIKNTYQGLIKTTDNQPLGATASPLTDGFGNELPLQLSQTDVNFTGNVDFSGATVSGLVNDLPTGGTTGQVLAKIDATDYNVEWTDVSGGGGSTPPMSISQLPPIGSNTLGQLSLRTWVATTGFSVTSGITLDGTNGYLSVFSMYEGEKINRVNIAVQTATVDAQIFGAIYRLGINPTTNNMIITDKLYDIPTVSGATSGMKEIDISSNPFIMPSGEQFGAVAIIFSSDISGPTLAAWSNAVWSGNGGANGGVAGTTYYRAIGWYIGGLTNGVLPSSLQSNGILTTTSSPFYIAIR